MCEKDWIDILSGLSTPMVAIIAVYIAWQQWRTAERKRRQDLFDKRYAFFEKLWAIYADHIISPEEEMPLEEEDFLDYAHEVEFLFGPDISKHMFNMPKNMKRGCLDYDWFSKPFKKYLKLY